MVSVTAIKDFMENFANVKEVFMMRMNMRIVDEMKMKKFAVDVELVSVEFVIVLSDTIHRKYFTGNIANVIISRAKEIVKNW